MKQVIVVNEALALPRGKLASQVAHASVAAFLAARSSEREGWLSEGMPKIVVACATERDLLELHAGAVAAGLPADLVTDAGRTVVPPGTPTCLGIGPAPEAAIDALTGSLPLLR